MMGDAVPDSDLPDNAVPESDLPDAGVKAAPSAPPPSLLSRALSPIGNIPHEIADEFRAGSKTIADTRNAIGKGEDSAALGGLKIMGGAAQQAFSPVVGTAKAIMGDPLGNVTEGVTGSKMAGDFVRHLGTEVGSMVGPGAVTKSLSKMADAMPEFDKSVQMLLNAGLKLTPGMIWQGAVKSAEDFLGKMPISRSLIHNGQREGLESFNRVMLDKSLEPLGERLPEDLQAGRKAIGWAQEKIGDAYEKILPKLDFPVTKEFLDDMAGLRAKAGTLREAEQKQLAAFGDDVAQKFNHNGYMSGKTYKQVDSELSTAGRGLMKSPDPEQRRLGGFLSELRGIMMDNLERANPKYAGQLKDVNSAYAAFIRLQDASTRRVKSGGIFSPDDLLQAIRQQTPKGVFARGDGLYQDLAQAASKVLPSDVPKGMGDLGHGVLAGILSAGSYMDPALAATIAAGSLPYTKTGLEAVRRFAGRTPGQSGPILTPTGMAASAVAGLPDGYNYRQEQALEGAHTRRPGRPSSAKVPIEDAASTVSDDSSDPYAAVAQ